MTIEKKKQNLLRFSANEVRNDRALFADFKFIYISEGGNEKDCMGCSFRSVFSRWKRESQKTISNDNQKKMSNNSFKLNNEREQIAVPGTGKVITKDSPDEMVNEFLDQEDGKHRESRIKRFFLKVPEGNSSGAIDFSKMKKKELLDYAENLEGFEFNDEVHSNNEKRAKALEAFVNGKE